MNRRYCLALDLKDDQKLIESYKKYHRPEYFRPESTASIKKSGIVNMEIYLTGNRLFMIMEGNEGFDFQHKARLDRENEQVQEWESFVSQFQQRLTWAQESD